MTCLAYRTASRPVGTHTHCAMGGILAFFYSESVSEQPFGLMSSAFNLTHNHISQNKMDTTYRENKKDIREKRIHDLIHW